MVAKLLYQKKVFTSPSHLLTFLFFNFQGNFIYSLVKTVLQRFVVMSLGGECFFPAKHQFHLDGLSISSIHFLNSFQFQLCVGFCFFIMFMEIYWQIHYLRFASCLSVEKKAQVFLYVKSFLSKTHKKKHFFLTYLHTFLFPYS